MTYHYPVDAGLDLFAYGFCQDLVLVWTHVFAEYGKKFLSTYVAHIGQFGHGPVQLTRREGRDDCPGTVVEARCDSATSAEELNIGLIIGIRELLLRYFIISSLS